jgi:hypothetical protein
MYLMIDYDMVNGKRLERTVRLTFTVSIRGLDLQRKACNDRGCTHGAVGSNEIVP